MPVEPATLVAFALTAAAIVVSPGPDTFLILRSALADRTAGYAAVLGVQLGLLVHTAFAIFGLSILIANSPKLFDALAVAGAIYLAYLGIQGLRATGALAIGGGQKAAARPMRALRDAMLTNLLNPKVLVLFLALYPNFVASARGQVTAQLLTLSATLIAINVAWQAPLAWGAHQLRRWLLRPKITGAIARTASAVLIAFAALLLYDHFR
jgi:threonine/homoserine/homoserine lactone efflux protein